MIWRIQTLGGLTATRGSHVITRFESSRVAALLAHLALFSKHPIPREELIELLWPEEETERGRQRLRQAIYSLRRQLEPPGIPPNTVLIADRLTVRLNPQSFSCDAVEFDRLVRERQYAEARSVYPGELLPGFYDEWILDERNRLQAVFDNLPEAALPPKEPAKAALFESGTVLSLPGYLTEYFGRLEERRRILEQLASRRLVTVTGMGGIGKTRIAVEVAREASSRYDRTAFVPLEACVSPDQILEHIPPALQLPPSQSSPMDQMIHALGGIKVLLVLDNLEQLAGIDGGSQIEEMLARFPGMTCLVTSRRLLCIEGEFEVSLSPLPSALPAATLEETAQNPGVALFISRAQAGRPGFQITESNRDDVVTLCNALDGLPLALEIAASRIRAFTPSEMLAQLEDRFRLLSRPGRGAHKDQRHRSVEATLEWSWRLLSPDQQQLLSALSVFRGGWTSGFAAEVCDAADAGERLEELAMDSLVISEETRERTTRFRLLEVVRVFVRERLEEEQARRLIRRHQAAYLGLARSVHGGDQSALFAEGENLKAALETAIEDREAHTALALCIAVGESWLPLVGPERAMELIQATLSLPCHDLALRVEGLSVASHLALLTQNRSLACAMASQAQDIAGDDPRLRARSLIACARAQMVMTREASLLSRSLLEEALPLIEKAGDAGMLGDAQRLLGVLSTRLGEYPESERFLSSSLESFERVRDRRGAMYSWDNLAGLAVQKGDLDRALDLYGEARRRAEENNEVVYAAKVLQNLATIYARQRRWDQALAVGQECIRRNQALGNAYILAYALWNLTEPLSHLQHYGEAARLMAFIERFWVEQYDPLNEDERGYCAMIYAQVEAALGETRAAEHKNAGARLTLDEAVRLSLQDLPV